MTQQARIRVTRYLFGQGLRPACVNNCQKHRQKCHSSLVTLLFIVEPIDKPLLTNMRVFPSKIDESKPKPGHPHFNKQKFIHMGSTSLLYTPFEQRVALPLSLSLK